MGHMGAGGRENMGPDEGGLGVTYHARDVTSLLKHVGQRGLIEWEATHRGGCEVVCDTIA